MKPMSSKIYDILKWVAIIGLPAAATLVGDVFPIWNLPYGAEISSTISHVSVFLGACLMISNMQYKKQQQELNDNQKEA